jgi:hypothetical protein
MVDTDELTVQTLRELNLNQSDPSVHSNSEDDENDPTYEPSAVSSETTIPVVARVSTRRRANADIRNIVESAHNNPDLSIANEDWIHRFVQRIAQISPINVLTDSENDVKNKLDNLAVVSEYEVNIGVVSAFFAGEGLHKYSQHTNISIRRAHTSLGLAKSYTTYTSYVKFFRTLEVHNATKFAFLTNASWRDIRMNLARDAFANEIRRYDW